MSLRQLTCYGDLTWSDQIIFLAKISAMNVYEK